MKKSRQGKGSVGFWGAGWAVGEQDQGLEFGGDQGDRESSSLMLR